VHITRFASGGREVIQCLGQLQPRMAVRRWRIGRTAIQTGRAAAKLMAPRVAIIIMTRS